MKKISEEILLDTHTMIWLFSKSRELKKQTVELINKKANNGNLYLAAISFWEVGTLVNKNRLDLGVSLSKWCDLVINQPGLKVIELNPQTAIHSTELGHGLHKDPVDRMLVATANLYNLTLLTRDRNILDYGAKGEVSVIKV